MVVADLFTVPPHISTAAATMEAIVEAGCPFGSNLDTIPQLLTGFPNYARDAACSECRGVDVDFQRVFVRRAAAVFDDAQVVWVDTVTAKATPDLKL